MFNRDRHRRAALPGTSGWSTLDDLLSGHEPPSDDRTRAATPAAEPVEERAADPVSDPATDPATADEETAPPPAALPEPPMRAEDVATWEEAVAYVEWLVTHLAAEGGSAAAAIRAAARRDAPEQAAFVARAHVAHETTRADAAADAARAAARSELAHDLRSVASLRRAGDDVATDVLDALADLRERHSELDRMLRSLHAHTAVAAHSTEPAGTR